jgi:hypothetical protein
MYMQMLETRSLLAQVPVSENFLLRSVEYSYDTDANAVTLSWTLFPPVPGQPLVGFSRFYAVGEPFDGVVAPYVDYPGGPAAQVLPFSYGEGRTTRTESGQFVDSTVQRGVLYAYAVYVTDGFNLYSTRYFAVRTSSIPAITQPSAPINVVATTPSSTDISLSWTDASNNESNFIVQRRFRGDSAWATIATLPADSVAYTDASALRKVVYDYRVLARNSAGDGTSSPVTVSTFATTPPRTATVSGSVFVDSNYSTTRDPGEPGASGRVVYIDRNNSGTRDASEPFATTDAAGNYTLANLPSGTVRVRLEDRAGFYQSTPFDNAPITRTLTAGQESTGAVFGTQAIPSIVTLVTGASTSSNSTANRQLYIDRNRNGRFDAGENVLRNRTVFIDTNNNGRRDASEQQFTLDTQGRFTFSGTTIPNWRRLRVAR